MTDIAEQHWRELWQDAQAEVKSLEADGEMKDSRIDWTVQDNAKKAIELADLRAERDRLKDACRAYAVLDKGSHEARLKLGAEVDRLKADNERLLAALDAIEQLHRAALENKP